MHSFSYVAPGILPSQLGYWVRLGACQLAELLMKLVSESGMYIRFQA